MTEAPPVSVKIRWAGVVAVSAIFLAHLVALLAFADIAINGVGMARGWRGDEGGVGVRFGESVYWSPKVFMGAGERSLMVVFWSYPIWLAAGTYGSLRFLRRGRSFFAVAAGVLPFLPFLSGFVAIVLWSMEVMNSGNRFFEECRMRHPGVPGFIVLREKDGEVVETKRVVGHGPER